MINDMINDNGMPCKDRGELDLTRAFAFGDNPAGNDAPLASFALQGTIFVAMGPSHSTTIPIPSSPLHCILIVTVTTVRRHAWARDAVLQRRARDGGDA